MRKNKAFYEQLNVAIDLLAAERPDVNSDYKALAELVNESFPLDFNGEVTERDIWLAFEPDIPEEELDAKLAYGHLFQQHYSD